MDLSAQPAGTIGGLVIPLVQRLRVRARRGEECFAHLGRVPVRGADPRGVWLTVELWSTVGKGRWSLGLRWPGEEEVWAEGEMRLEDGAVGIPIEPDADGRDADVDAILRLRPLGPEGTCSLRVSAAAHVPV